MRKGISKELRELYKKPFFIRNQEITHKGREFFSFIVSAQNNAKIYPPNHPLIIKPIKDMLRLLEEMLITDDTISLTIIADEVHFGGLPLIKESITYSKLIKDFKDREIDSVSFQKGLTEQDLIKFIGLLDIKPEVILSEGGIMRLTQSEDIKHILFQRVSPRDEIEGERYFSRLEIGRVKKNRFIYFELIELCKEIQGAFRGNKPFDWSKIRQQIDVLVSNIGEDRDAFLRMMSYRERHEYNFSHPVNVAILALAIAKELGADKKVLKSLAASVLFHDIGKLRIPDEIMEKDGYLLSQERELLREHPVIGARILLKERDLERMAKIIAFEHHYRYDSRGYPSIIVERDIYPFSKIVAIADIYDSLMNALRLYKKRCLGSKVINFFLEKGSIFFSDTFVKVMVNILGIYPPGSIVKLDSGELGVVYRINPYNILRPRVVTIDKNTGKRMEINLMEIDREKRQFKRTIVEELDLRDTKIDIYRYL